MIACERSDGSGRVDCGPCGGSGGGDGYWSCPDCRGRGWRPCPECEERRAAEREDQDEEHEAAYRRQVIRDYLARKGRE